MGRCSSMRPKCLITRAYPKTPTFRRWFSSSLEINAEPSAFNNLTTTEYDQLGRCLINKSKFRPRALGTVTGLLADTSYGNKANVQARNQHHLSVLDRSALDDPAPVADDPVTQMKHQSITQSRRALQEFQETRHLNFVSRSRVIFPFSSTSRVFSNALRIVLSRTVKTNYGFAPRLNVRFATKLNFTL